jgi:hypothetical protein
MFFRNLHRIRRDTYCIRYFFLLLALASKDSAMLLTMLCQTVVSPTQISLSLAVEDDAQPKK